jgi:hypothetical protein
MVLVDPEQWVVAAVLVEQLVEVVVVLAEPMEVAGPEQMVAHQEQVVKEQFV